MKFHTFGILLLIGGIVGVGVYIYFSDSASTPPPVPELGASPWKHFESPLLGVALDHPAEMVVLNDPGIANFNYWGQEQVGKEEFVDGVTMAIAELPIPEGKTLQQVAADSAGKAETYGRVLETVAGTTTPSGHEGVTYLADLGGVVRFYFIPVANDEALRITYLIMDPRSAGYAEKVHQVLASLMLQTVE